MCETKRDREGERVGSWEYKYAICLYFKQLNTEISALWNHYSLKLISISFIMQANCY